MQWQWQAQAPVQLGTLQAVQKVHQTHRKLLFFFLTCVVDTWRTGLLCKDGGLSVAA
jgi:hypothetical protein